ncbi:PEP-CTERM sorting domain-containing protein [Pirellulales bacterium]|nr:PEP-CTERM sorting domain-containing protein [Pirellulales bacterium]
MKRVTTWSLAASLVLVLGGQSHAGFSPLLNEFSPNPPGGDPSDQDVELIGVPSSSFSGWILSIESDPGGSTGTVDRATEVSGSFDGNGLLVLSIPDLENPSNTVILTDDFTGTAGSTDIDADNDGTADDLSTIGIIYDALGVSDTTGEPVYGAQLGGVDLAYIGSEPELVFREANSGNWYANDFNGDVFDASAVQTPNGAFDKDPLVSTFGDVNPAIPEPTSLALLAIGGLGLAMRRRHVA